MMRTKDGNSKRFHEDNKFRRYYFFVSLLIVFFSYLTTATDIPKVLSPHSIISLLGQLILENYNFYPLLMCMLFLVWSHPIRNGSVNIPTRTIIVAITLSVLSFTYLLYGFSYSVQYQGIYYVLLLYGINFVFWMFLLITYLANKYRASFITNLLFHGLFFIWLSWIAFPWMGELI